MAANALRAFEAVFEDCAADADCQQQYPDLEETFYQVIDELNQNPVEMDFNVYNQSMLISGETFMETIFLIFYIEREIEYIPQYIHAANQGELIGPRWIFPYLNEREVAWGVFHSFQCREQIAYETEAESLALREGLPQQILGLSWPPYELALCESWGSGIADPVNTTPVVSDVPTLIIAGDYAAFLGSVGRTNPGKQFLLRIPSQRARCDAGQSLQLRYRLTVHQ